MPTILAYKFAAVSEVDGVLTVGFADAEFETQEYLMLQRWLEDKDEEIYLERDGQGQGFYGGIERFVLTGQQALLWLSTETARAIDTQRELQIHFPATNEQFRHLQDGLERVFSGLSCFEVNI